MPTVNQPLSFTWDGVSAGQTWTVTGAERDGSTVSISPIFTDLGDGRYRGVFTPNASGVWSWRVESNRGLWETFEREAITAAQFDPVAALAAGTVTVVSPVDALTGDATVYQGDDQQAADSRSLDWSASSWPDLTGASIALTAHHARDPRLTATATGSVVTPTGEDATVRVELTSAETAALTPGPYAFRVRATLASGNIVTLVVGTLTVVGE